MSKSEVRGVNDNMDSLTIEQKKAQWNMIMAKRALNALSPYIFQREDGTIVNRGYKQPKYTGKDLISLAYDYFNDIYQNNEQGIRIIPDIEDFCTFINLSRSELFRLEQGNNIEVRQAISMIRNFIASCKKQLALDGKIPPVVFAIDFNNNHDYVNNRSKVDITVDNQYEEVDGSVEDIMMRLPQEEPKKIDGI